MQGHLQNGLSGEAQCAFSRSLESRIQDPETRITGGGGEKFAKSWASPTLHWRGLRGNEKFKNCAIGRKLEVTICDLEAWPEYQVLT